MIEWRTRTPNGLGVFLGTYSILSSKDALFLLYTLTHHIT